MEDVHRLAGDEADDIDRIEDVEGDAQATGDAVALVHHPAGRGGEVRLCLVGIFGHEVVHGRDHLGLRRQLVQLLGLAEAAGGGTEVVREGGHHIQRDDEARARIGIDVVHRTGDIAQHIDDGVHRLDKPEVGAAEAVGQAKEGGVATDDVAQDGDLGVERVQDGLDAIGDRRQLRGDSSHVIGDEGPEVDVEVVVAELGGALAGCPGDAHGVADGRQRGRDATAGDLQRHVNIQANSGNVQDGLEEAGRGEVVDLGECELVVEVGWIEIGVCQRRGERHGKDLACACVHGAAEEPECHGGAEVAVRSCVHGAGDLVAGSRDDVEAVEDIDPESQVHDGAAGGDQIQVGGVVDGQRDAGHAEAERDSGVLQREIDNEGELHGLDGGFIARGIDEILRGGVVGQRVAVGVEEQRDLAAGTGGLAVGDVGAWVLRLGWIEHEARGGQEQVEGGAGLVVELLIGALVAGRRAADADDGLQIAGPRAVDGDAGHLQSAVAIGDHVGGGSCPRSGA